METSPVYQTCRVQKDYGEGNYAYHWIGPDGRRISDNNQLKIDYALRTKHSGAYTCVAMTNDSAQKDLEGTVYIIVSREFPFILSLNVIFQKILVLEMATDIYEATASFPTYFKSHLVEKDANDFICPINFP